MNKNEKSNFSYDVVESIGTLATYSNGWTKEFNLISWNGKEAKYDIRDWDPDHQHMSRGITLRPDELGQLYKLLAARMGAAPAGVTTAAEAESQQAA